MPALTLHTSSHSLHLYYSVHDLAAPVCFYALESNARPHHYSPIKLSTDCALTVDHVPSEADEDSRLLTVKLANNVIGTIDSNDASDVDQFAKFSAQWTDAIQTVADAADVKQGFYPLAMVSNLFNPTPAPTRHNSIAPLSTEQSENSIYMFSDARAEFLVEKVLRFRFVTWNLHGEPIIKIKNELYDLLGLPTLYDLYVIAIQESDILGPKNLYANTTTLSTTKEVILDALKGTEGFQIVAHNQLLGMMILVIAADSIADKLSRVQISTTGTGLFGIWGNKGAASVRVRIGEDESVGIEGRELVFVNCHLAAGEGKPGVDRRRWELQEIERKLEISGLVEDLEGNEVLFDDTIIPEDEEAEGLPPSRKGSMNYDRRTFKENPNEPALYFVLGDLNYRVALDPEMVIQFVSERDYETVLNHDQLSQQIIERKVFPGFEEPRIKFPPTYKYAVGTDDFDDTKPGNSDRARAPSYTDRILYSKNKDVKPLEYKSLMKYRISDHKPVFATFEVSCKLVDPVKRKAVVDRVLKQSDSLENSHRANITITPPELLVKDGTVLRESTGFIIIEQKSPETELVEWEIELQQDPSLTETSYPITVTPKSGFLPYEATQYVHFSTILPVRQHKANSQVQAVAILRIKDGQDLFIPIEFQSLPTCLGASLDLLSRMPEGARNKSIMESSSTNMPKEIWNCIDYLWSHILPDMFSDSVFSKAEESIMDQVQEWMDTGTDFDTQLLDTANEGIKKNSGTYSVAYQFLTLLKYIDGRIIPAEYYSGVMHGKEGAMMILERIPRVNVNVLLYLCSFMNRSIENGVGRDEIINVFDPLIIEQPPTKDNYRAKQIRKAFILELVGI